MKVKIADVFLANGGIQSPSGFRVEGRRLIQTVDGLRWEQGKFFDRGNIRTTVSFTIQRVHSTVAEAEKFILDHAEKFPRMGTVEFISEGRNGGSRFIGEAIADAVLSDYVGVTTTHSYTIIGGKVVAERSLLE